MSNKNISKNYTTRLTQTALTASVALILAYLEMILPDLPFVLPGMKLGLSNIATMFALEVLSLPSALFICLCKAVLALIMRGFTAFLMSLTGGILSTVFMFLLIKSRKIKFGYIGVGIGGAWFHNIGQLIIAYFFTDKSVFAYLPVLCLSAILTGTVTALTLFVLLPNIIKMPVFKNQNSH